MLATTAHSNECDEIGAHPFDNSKPTGIKGVSITDLEPGAVIIKCGPTAENNPRHAFNLGRAYYKLGEKRKSIAIFLRSAELGSAPAQNWVGIRYENGKDGFAKNIEMAAQWYRKAADQNFAPAQFALGLLYDTGRGVPRNERTALQLFERGKRQNHPNSINSIGIYYFRGKGGLPQDDEKARAHYKMAAELGSDVAQRNLNEINLLLPARADTTDSNERLTREREEKRRRCSQLLPGDISWALLGCGN